MLSAERVIEYSKLQPEASLGTPPGREQPPELWPQSGAIHLHQMKFRYAEDTPYILKGISVDINPGEKVGISATCTMYVLVLPPVSEVINFKICVDTV